MTLMTAAPIADELALSDRVRRVHAKFPTGVAVVTVTVDGLPYGLAVNALASVSLDPAVILFCVAKTARTHDRLLEVQHAAVNFLSHKQAQVARRFATSGGDKFESCDWRPGPSGSPILRGVSAWLEVGIVSKADAVTHTIFTAQVREAAASNLAPLVYVAPGFFDGAQLVEAT